MKSSYELLYEDPEILVVYKPHGLAVQTRKSTVPDLEHLLLSYLAKQTARSDSTGKPYLAVIHRLDQPVAGILVFAKTPGAAKNLNRQLTGGGFSKEYLAVCDGIPGKDSGTLTDYMVKDGRTNTSRICSKDTAGAKKARLSYQRVTSDAAALSEKVFGHVPGEGQSLLKVTLDTGRHHQIRVQLAAIGCPIAGDTKYNPGGASSGNAASGAPKAGGTSGGKLMLCACHLSFLHPKDGRKMEFRLN